MICLWYEKRMSRWGNLLVLVVLAVSETAFAQIRDPHDPNQPIAPYAQPKLQIKNMTQDTDHVKEVKLGEIEEEYNYDPTQPVQSWGNCLDADVWVIVDYSDSMSGYETLIASALKEIATGLLYEPTLRRLGLITFDYTPTVDLRLTSDFKTAMKQVIRLSKTSADNGTDIDKGLRQAREEQEKSKPNPNIKSNEFKKIIILISDGEDLSNDENIIKTAVEMKKDGWWIYSIMANTSTADITQGEGRQFFMDKYNLLKAVSGNPFDGESYYIDSILLKDLPQHFREKFSCM